MMNNTILPDDEFLSEENYVAWMTIQQSAPDAETTHRILSAIMDDHLIIKVTRKSKHIWNLTLTAMEHVDNCIVAKAVWEREFGPFLVESQAYQFAEKYLHHVCNEVGIPFRFLRCDN